MVAGFPSPVQAGVAGNFTVTALDEFGNVATGYRGTIHFTSSDSQAVLPADYTFTAADAGVHTFSATLNTTGSQTLTASDGQLAISDDLNVTVNAASTMAVLSFTLINADTDLPIASFDPLTSGSTLNLATLPTRNLNVRANVNTTSVGSVRFALDANANFRTENTAPYALAGDSNGDFSPWTPTVGTHTLTATPYSGAQRRWDRWDSAHHLLHDHRRR